MLGTKAVMDQYQLYRFAGQEGVQLNWTESSAAYTNSATITTLDHRFVDSSACPQFKEVEPPPPPPFVGEEEDQAHHDEMPQHLKRQEPPPPPQFVGEEEDQAHHVEMLQHLERQPENTVAEEATVLAAALSRAERKHQTAIARLQLERQQAVSSAQAIHQAAVSKLTSELSQLQRQAQTIEAQRTEQAKATAAEIEKIKSSIVRREQQVAELETQAAGARFASGGAAMAGLRVELKEAQTKHEVLTKQLSEAQAAGLLEAKSAEKVGDLERLLANIAKVSAEIARVESEEAAATTQGDYAAAARHVAQLRKLHSEIQVLFLASNDHGGADAAAASADSAACRQLAHTKAQGKAVHDSETCYKMLAARTLRPTCALS